MNDDNKITMHHNAQIIYNLMYGKKRMDILRAYSYTINKYKTDYSYDEIKDYLFHHTFEVTEK